MKRWLGALLLLAGGNAWGHGIYCQCQALDATQVRCVGGLSDGTATPGATLDVLDDEGQVLIHGILGEDSSFTFERPSGAFHVLLELGPGHTAEVEPEAIRPR